MEFTPGKYRMANGEQAIVVCDVGENPIGPSDPFPLKGYCKSGSNSWTRNGKGRVGFTDSHDLREPWTDPPTALELAEAVREVWPHPSKEYIASNIKNITAMADAVIAAEKARTA